MNEESREFRTCLSYNVREQGDDGRTFTGLATVTGVRVQLGWEGFTDIIHNGSFKKTLKERSAQVRHLWQHDFRAPPIATIRDLREIGRDDLPSELRQAHPEAEGALAVTRTYLNTPRGNEIVAALNAEPRAITEMSIGFDPTKFDFEEDNNTGELVRHTNEVRLWDTSDVLWGAVDGTIAALSAVPYRATGKAPVDTEWRAPELSDFTAEPWESLGAVERNRIAAHFAWAEQMPPVQFSDLKGCHHQARREGIGPVVWHGVEAAMDALSAIPAKARRSVYEHLRRHYATFEQEAPEFRRMNLICEARDLLEVEQYQKLMDLLSAEPAQSPLTPAVEFDSAVAQQLAQARVRIAKLKGS